MSSARSLRRREDVHSTLRRGRRTGTRGFTIVAVRREDGGEARLALAVRAGGAVTRNRVKRRLRAAVRESGVAGVDLVVKADRSVLGKEYQEMVELVRRAAERADA